MMTVMSDTIFEVLHATCPAVVQRMPNIDYFVESYQFSTPEEAWRHKRELYASLDVPLSPSDYVIVRRVPTGKSNHKGPTWVIDWTNGAIDPTTIDAA